MKITTNCCFILGIFLLLFQRSFAQRGYNYARPALGATTATGASNVAGNIPTTALGNALRPIVPILPTGSAATAPGYAQTATAPGFSQAPTAFGAPSPVGAAQIPTGFGGGYQQQAQAQRPLTPTVATQQQQRTAAARFGANLGRPQTTQFTNIGTTAQLGTGTGADYSDGEGGDYSAIPGLPGVNYPIYAQVPPTSFDCAQQALPGYYSDVEAQCQVFHICALNRTYSFLCPNGTIFSQEVLVCVWWNQYDCSTAPSLYANNAFIYDYGTRVTPTAADATRGYQVGIGGGGGGAGGGTTRSQSNFPITTNTARATLATTATATQPAGIFGTSIGLRPTVTTGGFGGYTTPITPAPTAAFGSRLQPNTQTATTAPQTYGNTAALLTTGAGTTGVGGVGLQNRVGLQPNVLQTAAQLATSTANREYLPPAQRT